MKDRDVFEKYQFLKHLLRPLRKVAVAFSGGVDSSLLLFAAIETLGSENVMALHGRSCLNYSEESIEDFYQKNYPNHSNLYIVDLEPLSWPEFTENKKRRCYFCKKKTYTLFRDRLPNGEGWLLIDGTNADDLKEDRPGLKVLEESNIIAPLAEASITKKDVRFMARAFGLENHSMPSNSCLATRLTDLSDISQSGLNLVEKIEVELKKMGFAGCRAKPVGRGVKIEVRQQDFRKIVLKHNRLSLLDFCNGLGLDKVYLDLAGRM